jgi:hypothetical protein
LRHEEEARLRRWYYIMDPFYKERILISDADEHQKLLWRSIHCVFVKQNHRLYSNRPLFDHFLLYTDCVPACKISSALLLYIPNGGRGQELDFPSWPLHAFIPESGSACLCWA